jgi:opacity protein-like surface antigen
MRTATFLLLAGILILLSSAPAAGQLYCFVGGGADFPREEFDVRVYFIDSGIRTETKNGFLVNGGVGYQALPNLRVEGQVGYRSSKIDDVELKYINVVGVGVIGAEANITSLSFMANAWCDFYHRGSWSPYFGGGVGIAQVSLKDFVLKTAPIVPNFPITETLLIDDEDSKFAYQFGAGMKLRLNQRFIVDLGYRYFSTLEVDLADALIHPLEIDYSHQSVQLGITYTFPK